MKKKILITGGIIFTLIFTVMLKDTITIYILHDYTSKALAEKVESIRSEFIKNKYIEANLESFYFVKEDQFWTGRTEKGYNAYGEKIDEFVYADGYEYIYSVNLKNLSKYNIFVKQSNEYIEATNKYIEPNKSIYLKDNIISDVKQEYPILLSFPVSITTNLNFKFQGKNICFEIPVNMDIYVQLNKNGESNLVKYSSISSSIPKKEFVKVGSMFTSKMYKVDDSDSHITYPK